MGGSLDKFVCPWCGAKAVDVTCSDERDKRYLCVRENREFYHGEGPEPEPEEEDLLDELSTRVAEKIRGNDKRPSLFQRLRAAL